MKSLKWILLSVVIVPLLSGCGYNRMVELEENIDASWAQVENVYQRRADLAASVVEVLVAVVPGVVGKRFFIRELI